MPNSETIQPSPRNDTPLAPPHLADVDAVILAGGPGTRLDGVLEGVPKLLAPVGGRPFLDYLVAWLSGFGVRRIILSLGDLGHKVVRYIEAAPDKSVEFVTAVEPARLGTAGGLRFVRRHIRSNPALVVNGDSYVAADLREFLNVHLRSGRPGTILCTEVDNAGRFGSVEFDSGGHVASFAEKRPGKLGRGFISSGVYLMDGALLNDIAAGDQVSLERDVFARLPPGSLAALAGSFDFVDIGTPESLAEAQTTLRRYFPEL